jgi:predicted flap endonuclease-1-like 5' DNA nuclease
LTAVTLNPAHILETALLLLAAFVVGAIVGSLARVVVFRLTAGKPAAAAAAPPVAEPAAAEPQPALVSTPVIEPVVKPAQPTAPADVPVPDFAEVIALTASAVEPVAETEAPRLELVPAVAAPGPGAAMAPARVAGQTTSGLLVPSPRIVELARAEAPANGPGADVIPFPSERAEAPEPETAHEPPAQPDVAAAPVEDVPESQAEPAVTGTVEVQATAAGHPVVSEPAIAATAPLGPEQAPAAPPAEPPAAHADDEAAAMRAIEGGWAPKRNPVRRAAKAPRPEGIAEDEPASSRRPPPADETPGRPEGLEGPRSGTKDNLTNIIGVLPVIETALNQAGIYHFDQIAGFTDENVAWLEAHLGIAGRIEREHWREQARELAIVSERARKVAGK